MNYKNFDKINFNLLNLYQSQKLSHAILLNGKRGIGKFNFALDFSKKLINTQLINHPNIKIIHKEDKKEITIDKIRKISDFVNNSAAVDNDKFIIIDDACSMNKSAANALLKILEEPKGKNFIFLICHNLQKIIPTIRSRCLIINAKPLEFNDFVEIISKSDGNFDQDELAFLYEICDGSILFAYDNGRQIIDLYKLLLQSFLDKSLDKKIYKIVTDKSFDFDIFAILAEFLCSRILKSFAISDLVYFFNERDLFTQITQKSKFDLISIKIEKSMQILNQVNSLNLDKKTVLTNFYNNIRW